MSLDKPSTDQGLAAVRAAVRGAKELTRPAKRRSRGRPKVGDKLLRLMEDAELWQTSSGEAFITISIESHSENWAIQSNRCRGLLARRFFEATGGAPSSDALNEALRVLEARALSNGPEHEAFLRVGRKDNAIYLDLATRDWRAIEITDEGWREVSHAPCKLIRSSQMCPLPRPEVGGSIDDLSAFLNLRAEGDFKLVITWILSALRPNGPFPILLVNGEQGASKSTLSRVLRSLVDPNPAPVRSIPRNERDLAVSAWNSWSLAFDNVSAVPEWLSDALCRLATGGGFGTRQLHSNKEEAVFSSTRPIILNGIPDLAARPDLADRGIVIVLPAIPRERRRTELEFWQAFEEAQPFILGALLEALAGALRHLPKIKLAELPRMADFACFGVAVEHALAWPAGSFLQAYEQNRSDAIHGALEASPIAQAVLDFTKASGGQWEGTAAELLIELEGSVPEKVTKSRNWPNTPSALGSRLRRVVTALRALGIDIAMERVGGDRRRMIYITNKP